MPTDDDASTPRLGRAPWTTASEMSPAQRGFVQTVRSQWAGGAVGLEPIDPEGRLLGSFDLMAASPEVGAKVLALAESFRDASLTVTEREMVIILVAATRESVFMWEGHAPLFAAVGLQNDLEAIRAKKRPDLSGDLAAVYDVAWALIHQQDLSDSQFQAAERTLGWPRVQEIVWLVGFYESVALAMRVARVPTPSEQA